MLKKELKRMGRAALHGGAIGAFAAGSVDMWTDGGLFLIGAVSGAMFEMVRVGLKRV